MMGRARREGLIFEPSSEAAYPLAPDHLAEVHVSKRGFYRVTLGIDRVIGCLSRNPEETARPGDPLDPTQSVHESVRRRWGEDSAYRPKSLREYFARVDDPAGSG